MKTKENTEKTFVKQLREIREKISFELKDKSIEQMKDYFNNQKTLHPNWYV